MVKRAKFVKCVSDKCKVDVVAAVVVVVVVVAAWLA